MSTLLWLTDAQMARLQPFFPKSHGMDRVDGRRVLSGIIFFNRNGLRGCDAPKEYGPPKTLYNRWKRWSDKGVFARMMDGLASQAAVPKTVMIDATDLKAHRTTNSLRSKTYGPPRLQAAIFDNMISLHKRIRHVGTKAAAKMEIRASQSS